MARLALLVLLCAPALGTGIGATRGLSWPPDVDLYRDIAQAQTIADGAPLADPFYAGEGLWYNPLVPGLVAGLSRVAGLPVHVVYARAGAYLNLLAPVLFFLTIEALFGTTAAALATLHLVYLRDPVSPPWLSPAYSPWLYTAAFVPALFFATLLAYRRALTGGARSWFVVTGALLGVTFLGHTAPAILAGIVVAVGFGRDVRAGRAAGSAARHGLLLAVAALAAAPFLLPIAVRYGFRVVNPAPLDWVWPSLTLGGLPDFLAADFSLVAAGAAVAALGWLLARDLRRTEASMVGAWALGAVLLFGLSLLRDATGMGPRLVPRHHFLFYWRLAESALLGYGAALLLRRFVRPHVPEGLRPLARLAAVAAVLLLVFPAYRERSAFTEARRDAERDDSRVNRQEAREWIRAHTAPTDVFLAADDLGLLLLGPSGRKTVSLEATFSNPYVDWQRRHDARDAMVADLRAGRVDAFLAAARASGVSYVIHKRSDRFGPDAVPALERQFQNARIGIYRVTSPLPPP